MAIIDVYMLWSTSHTHTTYVRNTVVIIVIHPQDTLFIHPLFTTHPKPRNPRRPSTLATKHSGSNSGRITAQACRMFSHWCRPMRFALCVRTIPPIWQRFAIRPPNGWCVPLITAVARKPSRMLVSLFVCAYNRMFLTSIRVICYSAQLHSPVDSHPALHSRGSRVV